MIFEALPHSGSQIVRRFGYILIIFPFFVIAKVTVGLENLPASSKMDLLKGKKIALITNQTAVNSQLQHSIFLFKEMGKQHNFTLHALFAPEHWIDGSLRDFKADTKKAFDQDGIPIYPLWGKSLRPTDEMLKEIDVLVYDIQDIGSRSYTYIANLFVCMEEAAKRKIPMFVLDRPNPINGLMIDGPMLEDKFLKGVVGYINVPYCHGMTVGELADFYNQEYKVECNLHVVPMQGWKRSMTFADTGLAWIPTSPNIPQSTSPLYYPITGIIGELNIVNIGVHFTLPFEILGAPFIDAPLLTKTLMEQKLPGIHFVPHYWIPNSGRFKDQHCNGVLIRVTDPINYLPVTTCFTLMGTLKSLYPQEFQDGLNKSKDRMSIFSKVLGSEQAPSILFEEKYITWKLRGLHENERKEFPLKRKKYLISSYS